MHFLLLPLILIRINIKKSADFFENSYFTVKKIGSYS
uniref:Uncharacterized protein n=1 Tax=Anguilla anguilla TaxID=7936 RepID=A0A0E9QGT2_ANGAN